MAIINIWRSGVLVLVLVGAGRRVGRCILRHDARTALAVQRRFGESPRLRDIFDDAAAAAGREIGQIRFFGGPLLLRSYPKCLFVVELSEHTAKGRDGYNLRTQI